MDEEFVANSFVGNEIVKLLNEFVTNNMKLHLIINNHKVAGEKI